MIRLIQRRLIVPRGDTGVFSIPILAGKDSGDASIFTIFNPLTHRKIFEKVMDNTDGILKMDLTHGDTVNLPVGNYVWDIKFYTNPIIVDEKLVSGTEVDSYYSAFQLPVCEIRETGDNLLMADDAPDSKLAPDQINYIDAAIVEIHESRDTAVNSAAEANTSATNAETSASAAAVSEAAAQDSQEAALASQQAAQAAATDAANSAAIATQKAAQIEVDLATKADKSEIPTLVSQLQNDAGYLNQETDPTVPAWAKAQTKPTYTAQEVGALPANTFIPSKVSDLTNDAGYLTEHQDISGKANAADLAAVATSGAYSDLSGTPTNVSTFTNDAGYLTQHQDISGKANSADLATVATSGSYNDLSNKPFIPSAISDLTDDSGHYTKPAGGIPASDLANGVLDVWSGLTYHTSTMSTDSDSFVLGGATDSPTEINKCLVTPTPGANVIPKFDYQGRLHSTTPEEEWDGSNAVATTEYVDNMISDNMPEIPTNVSELNNDAGYLTSYTETDPTVPSWAKAAQKPSYTAAEVGAPTVQEMNTAIGNAIGNINSFDMAVVQALPTQDISTHTIYLVPKTGETNDVYDEYVYINNAWEMIGNTQIDLSNYVQKTDYATDTEAGVIKVANADVMSALASQDGGSILINGKLYYVGAPAQIQYRIASNHAALVSTANQHLATFYGLAKAAGDTTQSQSDNAVGTYTTEAKAAIRSMLGAAASADVTVQDVQVNGTSIVQNGVANVPAASTSSLGVVYTEAGAGLSINNSGKIFIIEATGAQVKSGTNQMNPIVPERQHAAAFYGLAKAAGDTTQSISSNAVGTYTDEAKVAIKNMLGITQTLTITVLTQDNVTVTGQTVTVRAANATGHVFATAAYEGQPIAFAVPSGFAYYVSVSDTLDHHFNPTTASGVITDTDVSVTLTYSDFSTIQTAADIKAALNAGLDLTDLVGEQVSCTWNNSTLVWDVVDYSNDTITLLTHDTLPTQLVFEPVQALMWCENRLAAGSYSFIDGSSTYYFTLTTAIPSGGQLRATTSAFQTYASMEATATLETGTVSTTEISGATSLGTTASGNLNHMSRVNYGSNNYKESGLFQWLNSTEAANTPMPRITKFSRPCTYSVPGFLGALDSSFVAAIDDTTWLCSTNNTYECPTSLGGTVAKSNAYTVTAKVGLASEMEIFGSYGGTADGSAIFDLFNGATADDRKKYQPGTSTARYWWLRSPHWNGAGNERIVNSSGTANSYYAYNSSGVVPAVKISKTVVSE